MFQEFNDLPWSKREEFRAQPTVPWNILNRNSTSAGMKKSTLELQVASVDDAGHMSPGDQKQAVQALVQAWITPQKAPEF